MDKEKIDLSATDLRVQGIQVSADRSGTSPPAGKRAGAPGGGGAVGFISRLSLVVPGCCRKTKPPVLAAALRSRSGASREVIRQCLIEQIQPVLGQKLFSEYLDLFERPEVFKDCPVDRAMRQEFLSGFLSVCSWVEVFFLWRPNLPDEADNHVLELAVAAHAISVITFNVRDFRGELRFPRIVIMTPSQFLKMR